MSPVVKKTVPVVELAVLPRVADSPLEIEHLAIRAAKASLAKCLQLLHSPELRPLVAAPENLSAKNLGAGVRDVLARSADPNLPPIVRTASASLMKASHDYANALARIDELLLPTITRMAERFADRARFSKLDLMQEGRSALPDIVERFDCERGYRLKTYATWWVRQRMLSLLYDCSRTIRIPRNLAAAHSKLARESSGLPPDAEAAQLPKLPGYVSLDAPFPDGSGSLGATLAGAEDPAADFRRLTRYELVEGLKRAWQTLSERERQLFAAYNGLDGRERVPTHAALGREHSITRHAVMEALYRASTHLGHHAAKTLGWTLDDLREVISNSDEPLDWDAIMSKGA